LYTFEVASSTQDHAAGNTDSLWHEAGKLIGMQKARWLSRRRVVELQLCAGQAVALQCGRKICLPFSTRSIFFLKPQNVNLLAGGKPAFCHALKSSDLIRRRTHVFKPSF
jgi:hypothetical protein